MTRSRDAAMPEAAATPEVVSAPDGNPVTSAHLPMVAPAPVLPVVEAWCSALSECQREMADFVAARLEKDKECIREALAAKDVAEAVTIQARWMQQTMQDYAAEITRILGIYTRHGAIRPTTAMLH